MRAWSLSLIKRAITSAAAPPGAGTTSLTGFSGHVCALPAKGIQLAVKPVEWHPKLSHFEENLHPNLSHPNRLSCLIFEQGWARSDQRGNFEQIT
jgi:hypothetical protein